MVMTKLTGKPPGWRMAILISINPSDEAPHGPGPGKIVPLGSFPSRWRLERQAGTGVFES